MKKVVLLLLLAFPILAFAQENRRSIGITVGASHGYFDLNEQAYGPPASYEEKVSKSLGLRVQQKFKRNFLVRAGVLLQERIIVREISTIYNNQELQSSHDLIYYHLRAPITLNKHFYIGKGFGVALGAGVLGDVFVQQIVYSNGRDNAGLEEFRGEPFAADRQFRVNGLLNAGIEFNATNRMFLTLEPHLAYELHERAIWSNVNVSANDNRFSHGLTLTANYRF